MKQATLLLIALVAMVLPVSASKKAPVSYGGFEKRQQFTFRVTEKLSVQSVNSAIIPNAPVPKGMPNYSVGQTVTFTIGSKGELTAPGFKMPFIADGGSSNVYATKPSRKNPSPNSGLVFKNPSNNAPLSAAITFYAFKIKGTSVTVNTVTYTLNP